MKPGQEFYFKNPEDLQISFTTKYRFLALCPLYPDNGIFERDYYTSGGKEVMGELERIELGWMVLICDNLKNVNTTKGK